MTEKLHEWDADTYQRISLPHKEWAEAVIARLPLDGDETVLDAGCGTGRVTRILVERLPQGRVVAVDGSRAMVDRVREVLRPSDEALVADLTTLELAEPVDAIVSSAVFHWIADHVALFARMRAALGVGGRLVAQCGGAGNVDRLNATAHALAAEEPFAAHLGAMGAAWNFATPEDTEARLRAAGFDAVECSLLPFEVRPPEPEAYLRTVCLNSYLEALPEDLGNAFVAAVLEREGNPLRLGYVRLNISAVAA